MARTELRFRQIHMDFHTSEAIAGIGSKFDAEEFASTLERARVNSVTCFGRCHHGWIYYDTQAFPERRHPHLTCNLLKEQIEACHARGIRVPIYITVQWDHYTANQHPEWLCVTEKGALQGTPPYEAGFYRKLCLNTPYVDFLKAHVKEVVETLPTDGLFFDIMQPNDCSCRTCREGIKAKGLDPANPEQRRAYGLDVINHFERDMSKFVWAMNKDCTIFYNAGHIGPRHRDVKDAFSHFELESLPSGGWGYMHFPMAMAYSRTLGLDCMGMTGKFHTSWGDFHSFKNLPALQFECFRMLAYGAKCSIGDQLAPDGKICPHVYDLIGKVYMEVERKEPWCVKAKPVVDIGLFTTEEVTGERVPPQTMAAARMLQESGHQFDIIDTRSKLTDYKVIILPDVLPADKKLAKKIKDYLDAGGAMIVSYKSGLNEDGNKFAIKKLGLKLKGDAPYSPDFIVPRGEIGKGLGQTEHVMYMKGLEVKAKKNADVLAEVVVPYFNRTHEHFCSHKHTPSAGRVGYPGIVRSGNIIYFAHPIFGQYAKNAPRWCKQLVLNALDMLLPNPVLRLDAPTTALATVNEQGIKRRWIVHLLHYIPERRCQDIDVIEDVIPIHDVGCSLRVGREVKSVVCVPQEEALEFTMKDGRVEFTVSKVEGHQMVCVAFA